jgi:hypothetical protein
VSREEEMGPNKQASSRDRLEKVSVALYLEKEQHEELEALIKRTRIPRQTYLREAVDMLLAKYRRK